MSLVSLTKLSRKLLILENTSLYLDEILLQRPWVQDYDKERDERSEFYHVYHQSRLSDDKFYEYLRMSQETFDFMLTK